MTQYQRFELSRIDGEIAELEKKIAVKHDQRRELVNRMGLNKNPILVLRPYLSDEVNGIELVDRGCIDAYLDITSIGMNKCEHKSKTCSTSKCHCDDCGCQLPWQHEDLKP